jgi:arylsulfatase A-like enzyme
MPPPHELTADRPRRTGPVLRSACAWSVAAALATAVLACSKSDASGGAAASSVAPNISAPVPASSAPLAPPPAEKSSLRPPYNVLLLMIDSLRADMPWTGYPRPIAPRLTELSRECLVYTRAYSLSSYTAKSVAPALVGEYPSAMPRDGQFFTRYPDAGNAFVSERLQQAGHRTLAGHAHGYFMRALGNDQGFDDYRLIPGGVDIKAVTSVTSDRLTKLAVEMLSDQENTSQSGGRRFFAYFHYMDPHHTYERHREHPDFGSAPRDLYDNEVHYTDSWVAKLLDFAERQPWFADTAIIVTADHGEAFGEHGQFRHAYELWEALVRVPLLLCIPGAAPGRTDVRRSHIDLAPTIAELMGLPAKPPFRGTSLIADLDTPRVEPRRIVADLPRVDLMDRRRAVIDTDGHKLIAFGDDRTFSLYDLERDPEEKNELSESAPDVLERMKRVYAEESAKIPNVEVTGGARLKGAPPGRRW